MQGYENNQRVADANAVMGLAVMTVLGDREDQQDSFGYELFNDEGLVIVCDGMGGHDGGKLASTLSVEEFLKEYKQNRPLADPIAFLQETTQKANAVVSSLTGPDGHPLNAGSTLVAIYIRGNQLYWNSVGDSRAYLLRDGEFAQITLDHNYRTVLMEQWRAGLIDERKFNKESARAEALISYLGIRDLQLIDYNDAPLELKQGDKIVIMTDGLYKLATDAEIFRVVENFSNIEEALQALEMKAQKNSKTGIRRDNMTIALIEVL